MPVYKLLYFPARARAEVARLLFAAAGQNFEDQRLPFEQWGTVKASTPYGQLPVLYVDDKIQITQSAAICRYLAREFGMYGDTNLEAAMIDVVTETCYDVWNEMLRIYYNKEEDIKNEVRQNLKKTTLPKFKAFLENMIKNNGSCFLVGSKMSLADIIVFDTLDKATDGGTYSVEANDFLDDFELLKKLFEKVKSSSGITEYLQSRPPPKIFSR